MRNLTYQQRHAEDEKSSMLQAGHQIQSRLKKMKKQRNQKNNSGDELFEPDYHTMKKLKFPINRERLNLGNWSLYENKAYLSFLINNRQSFIDQATRRQDRVFCRLSQLLKKKRTPEQCRSHHQKLFAKLNNSIDDLIKKIEKKIETVQTKLTFTPNDQHEKRFLHEKIEEEKLGETALPQMEIIPKFYPQTKTISNRIPAKVIERDFYKLTIFKNQSLVLLQIQEQRIRSY